MRITTKEQHIIKKLAEEEFGAGTHVYIFGSRTDDNQRGGDIDIFISNKSKHKLTLRAKISFLTRLKTMIGDQKIDVVLDTNSTRSKKIFYRTIKKGAIEI